MNEIKKIYIGLPSSLANSVLWVEQPYRTNILSHQEGGSDIVVEYQSKRVLGYDWVKFPGRYIDTILQNHFNEKDGVEYHSLASEDKLQLVKTYISKIFARHYKNKAEHSSKPFSEIWSADTATTLPTEELGKLSSFEKKKYRQDFPVDNDDQNDFYSSDEYREFLEEEEFRKSNGFYYDKNGNKIEL